MASKVKLNVRVSSELDQALQQMAKSHGITKSSVVVQLLKSVSQRDPTMTQTAVQPRHSCFGKFKAESGLCADCLQQADCMHSIGL